MDNLKELWAFFLDWPAGTVIVSFSTILVLGSASVALYIVVNECLSAIDSWFMPRKKSIGEIIDKKIRPRFTEMEGAIDIPAAWILIAKVREETGDVSVSKELFDFLHQGDKVSLTYTHGRIYNSLNIKEIEIT